VPEIIDPVFVKTNQNARFLLSENERFGLVFVKTGVYKFGHCSKQFIHLPFTAVQAASFAAIQAVSCSAVEAGISCAEFRMYQRGENTSRAEAGGLALWSPF
jgi:hypothetical protein